MKSIAWIAAAILLLGAAMLLAGIGAVGYWITIITVGIALVIIARQTTPHTKAKR